MHYDIDRLSRKKRRMSVSYDSDILINVIRESCLTFSGVTRVSSALGDSLNQSNVLVKDEFVFNNYFSVDTLRAKVDIRKTLPSLSRVHMLSPPIQWALYSESSLNHELNSEDNPSTGSRETSGTKSDLEIPHQENVWDISRNSGAGAGDSDTSKKTYEPDGTDSGFRVGNMKVKNRRLLKLGRFIRSRHTSDVSKIDKEKTEEFGTDSSTDLNSSAEDMVGEDDLLDKGNSKYDSLERSSFYENSSEYDGCLGEKGSAGRGRRVLLGRSAKSETPIEDSYLGTSLVYSEEEEDDGYGYRGDFDSDNFLSDSDASVGSESAFPGILNPGAGMGLSKQSTRRVASSSPFSHRDRTLWKPLATTYSDMSKRKNHQDNGALRRVSENLKKAKENSKSTTSLFSLYQPKYRDSTPPLSPEEFTKKAITPCDRKTNSALTSLIKREEITLEYFAYVGSKDTSRNLITKISVVVPPLRKLLEMPLCFEINKSVSVVEVIGYALLELHRNPNLQLKNDQLNPNKWSLFLADDDGEIEDDMGPLERTRPLMSYGADELVLDICSDTETAKNEKLTPSPLIGKQHSRNAINRSDIIDSQSQSRDYDNAKPFGVDSVISTGVSNSTPVSGVTLSSHAKPRDSPLQSYKQHSTDFTHKKNGFSSHHRSLGTGMETKERFETGTETSTNSFGNNWSIQKEPPISSKSFSSPIQNYNGKDLQNSKDSKLMKFKNSKTLQSLLHTSSGYSQQDTTRLLENGTYQVGDAMPNMSSYHRWTVWRRQQMSFKNRHSKSLAVDGYQIYILPFDESKGSWYDSKTTSFNISQIVKIKQSSKVSSYFKIIVNKNNYDLLKKYYLEARNANECREIVETIGGLIRAYHKERTI